MASYNYNWPAVTINSGPVQFLYDGSTTTVAEDTSVPGNSKPLPVINLDPTGTPTDFNYGTVGAHTPRTAAQIGNATGPADFNAGVVGAQTLRTALASDQLSVLATEVTLAAAKADLDSLVAKDFATETTLVSAKVDLDALAAKDFATQTTLAAVGSSVGSIDTKTPALVSGRVPVDGSGVTQPVSVASLPLPTGAATAANQATEITSLASIDGKLPATLGQKTMAASLPVVLASNQSSIPVSSAANLNGANTDSTVSSAATLTAPANAIGFILMNLDTSDANIRWRIGATATASSGQQLQSGRDTGYIPCAANISICAESGTQNYNIQWILTV